VGVIIGPLAIFMANSMMGEVTAKMASAVSSSEAKKVLIPLSHEKVTVVGVSGEPLPHPVNKIVEIVEEMHENV
jgi:N-acetylglutamate synthase/N-acetylornithine aminotransferase